MDFDDLDVLSPEEEDLSVEDRTSLAYGDYDLGRRAMIYGGEVIEI